MGASRIGPDGRVGTPPIFMLFLCKTPFSHIEFLGRCVQMNDRKGRCSMGDIIAISFGVILFILLIVYVPACEKV